MTLTEDIISYAQRGKIYAKKGDEVTIVSESENVVIVEDKNGNRFPANKNQVK